jgi:2-dehydropantoate 2-reductase
VQDAKDAKIAIVGCGAIGSTFLAFLDRGGRSVTGIDFWPEHVHKVRHSGLHVAAVEESFSVRPEMVFPDAIKRGQKFDLVVLAMKSHENRWAVPFARDLLADDGVLISAQNGLHEKYLPDEIGGDRVVGCVVATGGELLGPGSLKVTTGSERTHLVVGELDGSEPARLDILKEVLSPLAPNERTNDIWSELWSKMTLNVMSNGLGGISGYSSGTLWTDDTSTRLIIGTGHEVALVADAVGQHIRPIMKTISHELLTGAQYPGDENWVEAVHLLREEGKKRVGMRDNASSLLQDLRKGRRTEVDYFNGVIGAMGKELGIPTPMNDLTVGAVHRVEEGQAATGRELLEEVADLADKYLVQ